MGNKLQLGRILGIELKLDYSWFIIVFLIAWSLAGHYFPTTHPGWSAEIYWVMAGITASLFFASVVAHELAHSLVSQAHGVPVRGITLFFFGGVAQISQEPKSARAEFLMALAGPATSLLIAGLFGLAWWASQTALPPLHALAGWLAWINAGLALFNLIPGFPLDGGRVFRSAVWAVTKDLRRATRLASGLGEIVAFAFSAWGIWQVLLGDWANGLWIALIGWFLQNAARASYQQLALRELLAEHTAREVMMTDCPHVSRDVTLDVLVDQVVLPSGRRCFPVTEADQVYGLLTLKRIKGVARERWATTPVKAVMIPRDSLKSVKPDDELTVVFERMTTENVNQFPVMENGRLLGMVVRDNLLALLRTRTELGVGGGLRTRHSAH